MQTDDKTNLIEDIRQWLKQENIHNAPQDRETILKFLTGCKNNVEKAKTKMNNFYKVRRTTPEIFHNRDPLLKNMDHLFALGALFPVPSPSPSASPSASPTVLVVRAAAHDPRSIPMTDVLKAGVMSVDLLLELNDDLTRRGASLVIDLSGVGLQHGLQMTPGLVRKMVHLWQDCYPIRIQGIDFVNAPRSVDVVLNIFRRFLGDNLKQRLRTHGSHIHSLHEVIAPELLPQEYGGSLGPSADFIAQWRTKVHTHRQWFLDDQTIN